VKNSRISGLHKLDVAERLDELGRLGCLSSADVEILKQGQQVLRVDAADKMVENVIGIFGLPLAIAPNFVVNGRGYLVPMVIEEPSVVAAVSNAAKQALPDGFTAQCDDWLLAGQVHVSNMTDSAGALARLASCRQELIDQASTVHPGLSKYGGGVREVEFRALQLEDGSDIISVHILVATGDAMGANIVNTICESLAPRIAEICHGNVALRILSNLADRSLVTATVNYRLAALATRQFSGEEVRDRIVMASKIASVDPYRAATHNKGIMNGVDAVAIATGNDWRAIEAGAHAYAALSGQYRPLACWSVAADGGLQGELTMPLRVATVGGTLRVNTAATMALSMTAVESSQELAQLVAAVGLAQNFAAIKALATSGIQEGHMRMHARSSVPIANSGSDAALHPEPQGSAAGKVILLGEHAVVYGKHAVALPIANAVTANITSSDSGESKYISNLLAIVRQELQIEGDTFGADVRTLLPPGMGLGVSAAIAVAIIRAVSASRKLGLSDEDVNRIAFSCEKVAHGNPSGVDNAIATFAVPMLFSNASELSIERLELQQQPPLVIAFSSQRGSTHAQVAGVRKRYDAQKNHYAAVFDEIDALSISAAKALTCGDYKALGALMNICHGLLNAVEVSTPQLDSMVSLARAAGAAGAKLTGGGGGGSVVALCPGAVQDVRQAYATAGFETLVLPQMEEG